MSGRQRNGQFAKGNTGGPGRPRRAVERDYLAVLSDAVSVDDWRAVVTRAVIDAKAGEPRAREWLAKYLVGERHHHDGSVEHQHVGVLLDKDWYGSASRLPATAFDPPAVATSGQNDSHE